MLLQSVLEGLVRAKAQTYSDSCTFASIYFGKFNAEGNTRRCRADNVASIFLEDLVRVETPKHPQSYGHVVWFQTRCVWVPRESGRRIRWICIAMWSEHWLGHKIAIIQIWNNSIRLPNGMVTHTTRIANVHIRHATQKLADFSKFSQRQVIESDLIGDITCLGQVCYTRGTSYIGETGFATMCLYVPV